LDKQGADYNLGKSLEGTLGLFIVALASCQWNPGIPGCRPVLWPNPLLLISAAPMLASTQAMAEMAMP
jgi:dolichol kinase